MPRRGEGPETFTVSWRAERVKRAPSGARLPVLFGGPHVSQPSFLRMDVRPGDVLVPVDVERGRLRALAALEVHEVLEVTEEEADVHRARFADWAFLGATCTEEVVLGRGTRVRPVEVPPELLASWTYVSNRGTRAPRLRPDGGVRDHMGFDAIYRVDASTGAALRELVRDLEPAPPLGA